MLFDETAASSILFYLALTIVIQPNFKKQSALFPLDRGRPATMNLSLCENLRR
jgi:hypothetical protein